MTLMESRPLIPDMGEAMDFPEPTRAEYVERFVGSAPITRGVYVGPLSDHPDGVYISPDIVSSYGDTAELPRLQEIQLLPGAQLGAGDSHHEVVFGKVMLKSEEKTDLVKVAFKSFTTESNQAIHEHDCLIAAKERGFDTYQPLALAKDGEDTYLITEFRDEVESMDNADWTISPQDSEKYQSEVVPNLHFMADNMAKMHAKGLFHGDAQPKNFARTDTGSFVLIDLENTTVATTPESHQVLLSGGWDPTQSEANADVWHCWYSMISPMGSPESPNTFLEHESVEVCMEQFEQNFLDPYMKALAEHTEPGLYLQSNPNELRASIHSRVARLMGL